MAQVNFSDETIKIRLLCPFYFNDIKTGKDRLIDHVVIQRLYATELSKLKGEFATHGQDANGFILGSRELTESYITHFVSEGEEITSASKSAILMKMPMLNIFKINIFGMMLTKETSLVATAYKCDACKKSTLFNLDPDYPVPKDVEEERAFMEDFLKFYSETWNKHAEPGISIDFEFPYRLLDLEGEEFDVFKYSIRWPTVGDYIRSSGDKKRQGDIELWTIFDCITGINELTEEETKKIKDKNGCERVMKLKHNHYSRILEDMNKWAVEVDHLFTCKHCGTENHQPFDYTNFFDFRRK